MRRLLLLLLRNSLHWPPLLLLLLRGWLHWRLLLLRSWLHWRLLLLLLLQQLRFIHSRCTRL